jgi:aromatic-L-amino-acid/L-tryptophan decarboxylase
VFLSSTELDGRFVLRACIVNYRSTAEDVDHMLDAVRDIAIALTTSSGTTSGLP